MSRVADKGKSLLREQAFVCLGFNARAWIEDRVTDLSLDTDDFQILPSEGETIIRITGDPVLVQALREIGIEAMGDKEGLRYDHGDQGRSSGRKLTKDRAKCSIEKWTYA